MNLVIEKLTEINEALKKFKVGEMTTEQVQAFVSLVNASHKWANMVLQAYAIESKNKRVMKGLERNNILDDHTAFSLGLPGEDAVLCPEVDKLIKREECLDYSGSHAKECEGCEHFGKTRKLILGD